MEYEFKQEQTCPACKAVFSKAQQHKGYVPVVVVLCPKCEIQLWRPGFDQDAPLVEYKVDADDTI